MAIKNSIFLFSYFVEKPEFEIVWTIAIYGIWSNFWLASPFPSMVHKI